MSSQDISIFFDVYAQAFSRADVDAIAGAWSLPAVISTAEHGPVCFADDVAFRRNTEALCAFYARQGVARAEKRVVSVQHLSAATASVVTADRLYDAEGGLVAAWKHAYVLRERAGRITAFAAVADGARL